MCRGCPGGGVSPFANGEEQAVTHGRGRVSPFVKGEERAATRRRGQTTFLFPKRKAFWISKENGANTLGYSLSIDRPVFLPSFRIPRRTPCYFTITEKVASVLGGWQFTF